MNSASPTTGSQITSTVNKNKSSIAASNRAQNPARGNKTVSFGLIAAVCCAKVAAPAGDTSPGPELVAPGMGADAAGAFTFVPCPGGRIVETSTGAGGTLASSRLKVFESATMAPPKPNTDATPQAKIPKNGIA